MEKPSQSKPELSAQHKKEEQVLKKKHGNLTGHLTESDIQNLLHELELSKTELEMQNEELRLAKGKAETALEQFILLYDELYDFSPVGYFTLDQNGIISELNDSGAKMLGKKRAKLININIFTLICQDSQSIFNTFLQKTFQTKTKETCEVDLINDKESRLYIHFESKFSETKQKCLVTAVNYTDIKHAQDALKESEEKFDSDFNLPFIGKAIFNMKGYLIQANDAFCQILGYPAEELYKIRVQEISHADDYEKDRILFNEILEKKRDSYEIEKRYFHKDGHIIYTILSVKVIFNDAGEPFYGISQIVDITQRKQAELAIKSSEEKYRKLHESLRDGFVYVSMDGAIQDSNKTYQDMLGYSQTELEKLSYFDLTPEKWLSFENKIVCDDILLSGYSQVYEKEYIKKDGTIFPVELRTFLLNDADNKPKGMWAIVRDISERKRTEEELKASEEKFKSIVESSPMGIFFFKLEKNDQLVLTGINPAANKIAGLPLDVFIGKTLDEIFPNTGSTVIPEIRKKIIRGEADHQSFEVYYQDDMFKGYFSVQAFKTGQDKLAVSFLDITERKKTEEILRQNEARLFELNATKDKFFSIIAHDLKNPFNNILGFSEMLKQESKYLENTSVGHYASLIYTSAFQTYQLLENLLTWARMQSGNVSFNLKSLILDQVIKDEFEIAINVAMPKNIELKSDVSNRLIIEADENMLRNILRNLISNAIKFTPKNGRVKISAHIHDSETVISVVDNGVGMNPENVDKLFKIEANFSTRGTENEKGTGLGLLLCKEFVEKHGGKIWAESIIGEGSKFYFTIPAIRQFYHLTI